MDSERCAAEGGLWLVSAAPSGCEEFVTVETGRIVAHIADTQLHLETGDSLYFVADVPHRFTNPSDEECRYYLIIDSHGVRA